MAYDSNGVWKMEDAGVADRVAAITASNTRLMKQARTQGLTAAASRGLGNSSMGIEAAQTAAYNAALPIAQQEATQINQTNLQQMGANADWQKTQAALAGEQQKTLAGSITDLTGQRYNALAATLNNADIPAEARNSVIAAINAQQQQALDFLQNIYGVNFGKTGTTTPTGDTVPSRGLAV